jgi:hypothetical protein
VKAKEVSFRGGTYIVTIAGSIQAFIFWRIAISTVRKHVMAKPVYLFENITCLVT